ncbi:GlsB/YeaQ/YmgE family stress response membrane protein [Rhodococcus sp. CSLK01-03]|uniref:GlsB/YeaQ/YmgE family stress response membrane protein n=1 Tax=Rhodococcus indonesiensis TaxID=3055869 RepID=A0ABT7RR68_9NOCA|nr:GlsB/YeaQ/YmgE family stress response membrane protein [Rhodococcus indonesiensis]MDM7490148.1 GlsB/YeaQ/YmgE family stress response membrane protein [Rhodococcus indonesiensis]
MSIIGTIVAGIIVGILARLVIPGKQAMGWLITVVIGIIGALIGYWVWYGLLDKGDTDNINWIQLFISVAAAVVLTLIYTSMTRDKVR